MSNYSPPSSRSSPNNPSNLSSTNSSSQLFGRKASLVERTTTAVIDKLTNSSSSQTGYLLRRTQTANASSSNLNSEPIVVGDNYSMNKEDYELGSAIGYGSSAVVYIAKYKPLNKNVAIKMIDLDMFERNQIDELRREIQIMSLSKHPNLLPVHGSFVNESKLYIVTPFLSAGSCLDIMKSAFPDGFEEAAIATILKQALQGLDYLHKNGLIHRDVKAGNLLVDDDGLVQLADFGVSSSLMDTGERRGNRKTFVGTPCWMAPEVMEQSGYDYKADIWSFGITALELSKGHAPYAKFPPMKVLLLTLQNDPPSLDRDATKHKYSKSFKDMIDTCLQKDPAKRPTAEKLLSHSFFKQGKKCSFLVQSILHNLGPIQQRAQNNRLPVKKLDNEGTGESWNFDSPVSSEEDLQKKVKFQSPTAMEPASYNTGLQMELGGESLNNSFSAPPNPNAVGKKSRFTTSTSTPTTSPPPENPTNNLPQTVPLASLNANSTLASKNSINVSTATLNAMINSGSLGPGSEMASNTPTGTANPANPVKKGRFTVNENTNLSASQSGSPSNTPVQAVVSPNSFTGLPQASPSTSVPPPNTLSGTDKKSRFLVSAVEGSTLWDPETQQQQQQQTTSNTHSPSPPSSIGRANSRFVTNTVRYEELSNTTTGVSPPTTLLYQERIELLFKQNELQKQMLNEVVGALYKNTKASTDPNDKLQERDALTGLDIDTPIIDTNTSPSQLLDNVRQMEKSFVTLLTQFEILRKENEKMRIENNGLRKEQENVRSDVESLKKLVNQLTSSAAGK